MATQSKLISKSDNYKYVHLYETAEKKKRWRAGIYGNSTFFDTEREAALCIDKILINKGKEPVNILVRK